MAVIFTKTRQEGAIQTEVTLETTKRVTIVIDGRLAAEFIMTGPFTTRATIAGKQAPQPEVFSFGTVPLTPTDVTALNHAWTQAFGQNESPDS